jgi:hypothetical protein
VHVPQLVGPCRSTPSRCQSRPCLLQALAKSPAMKRGQDSMGRNRDQRVCVCACVCVCVRVCVCACARERVVRACVTACGTGVSARRSCLLDYWLVVCNAQATIGARRVRIRRASDCWRTQVILSQSTKLTGEWRRWCADPQQDNTTATTIGQEPRV